MIRDCGLAIRFDLGGGGRSYLSNLASDGPVRSSVDPTDLRFLPPLLLSCVGLVAGGTAFVAFAAFMRVLGWLLGVHQTNVQ